MELKVDLPALAGKDIDPAAFQRVWNRVMPGQAAPREGEAPPVTPPDTSVPAEPSIPPEEVPPPAPDQPPGPPFPADTPPAPPDQPAGPHSAPQSECPDCPACPDCPQCPDTPPVSPPALCLGEMSQGDSGRLEELMSLVQSGAAAGRVLARRSGGSCAKALAALARDHRLAFRRLSAAYFLITGKRYMPQCAAPCLPASLPLALRQQFVWEQQWEQKNRQAAQATADPCLKELYLELAQEGAFHAGTIRSLLELM